MSEQMYQQLPMPHNGKLAQLAIEYHRECDAFDDGICSGKHKGVSIPVTSFEKRSVSKNARKIRAVKLAQALQLGFTEEQFQQALINASPQVGDKDE